MTSENENQAAKVWAAGVARLAAWRECRGREPTQSELNSFAAELVRDAPEHSKRPVGDAR